MDERTQPVTPGVHADTPREGSGKTIMWTVLMFVIIGAVLYYAFTRYSVTGTVSSTGTTLGEWTVHPTVCHAQSITAPKAFTVSSSFHEGWQFSFVDEASDPPVMTVTGADGRRYPVDADRCGKHELVENEPPDSGMLDGHVDLDCMVGDSHLKAHIRFVNCK